jgi:hypothetical protein
VIDLLAALLDQDVRAGDLAAFDLVLEEFADLRKLVLVETGPCGNIKRAFGTRRRCHQIQRTASQQAQRQT